MKLKSWLLEIRPEFLFLSLILVLLGTAIAVFQGSFSWLKFILTTIGLLLAHISVNLLNNYHDFKSGIDFNTTRTPFSGGCVVLPQGLLEPVSVYKFSIASLVTAFLIGIYLTVTSGWQILPIIFIGGGIIYFYTSHLTKWVVGEFFAGLGLGTLPVLGTCFVQTGNYNLEAVSASLAPGLLTANLLLLNEFPDYHADKKGGRFHLVIALGRKKAAFVYIGLMALTYLSIIAAVLLKLMPPICLIALLSTPVAFKAVKLTLKHYNSNAHKLIPAMRANIITVLGTDLLLAIAYFLSSILNQQ